MSVDVLEHFPPIEGVILVVALGHHLEARLEEGLPGEDPSGLRLRGGFKNSSSVNLWNRPLISKPPTH